MGFSSKVEFCFYIYGIDSNQNHKTAEQNLELASILRYQLRSMVYIYLNLNKFDRDDVCSTIQDGVAHKLDAALKKINTS